MIGLVGVHRLGGRLPRLLIHSIPAHEQECASLALSEKRPVCRPNAVIDIIETVELDCVSTVAKRLSYGMSAAQRIVEGGTEPTSSLVANGGGRANDC